MKEPQLLELLEVEEAETDREHKFIRLAIQDVLNYWPIVAASVKNSMPPYASKDEMSTILSKILAGFIDLWVLLRRDADDWTIAAVMTSGVTREAMTGDKLYFVYTFEGAEYIDNDRYDTILLTLLSHARHTGCKRISTISSNARLIRVIANRTGADDSYRYLVADIGDE